MISTNIIQTKITCSLFCFTSSFKSTEAALAHAAGRPEEVLETPQQLYEPRLDFIHTDAHGGFPDAAALQSTLLEL